MYEAWPFFRSTIELLEMVLSDSMLPILAPNCPTIVSPYASRSLIVVSDA